MSFAGVFKALGEGEEVVMKTSCPVAARVLIVLPWKDCLRLTIVLLPVPFLSKLYLRASLMAPSLASAPEFEKKTF